MIHGAENVFLRGVYGIDVCFPLRTNSVQVGEEGLNLESKAPGPAGAAWRKTVLTVGQARHTSHESHEEPWASLLPRHHQQLLVASCLTKTGEKMWASHVAEMQSLPVTFPPIHPRCSDQRGKEKPPNRKMDERPNQPSPERKTRGAREVPPLCSCLRAPHATRQKCQPWGSPPLGGTSSVCTVSSAWDTVLFQG